VCNTDPDETSWAFDPTYARLSSVYTFTGCDTIIAFAGKGNICALEILKRSPDARVAELGANWAVTPELQA
jgi:hypothetical protein